jgi:hypothetical protein
VGELATRRVGYQPQQAAGGDFGLTERSTPQDQDGLERRDDDKKFADQITTWFSDSARQTDVWRQQAIESYEFVSGQQWRAEDLDELGGRPCLTINKILGPVLFLLGVQRQKRTDVTLLPATGGDSVKGAQLMTALLKYIARASRENQLDDTIFADKIITGLGYRKVVLDYTHDPDGLPAWERPHPLSIFGDPNWFDLGWDAAEYVIHAMWMTRQAAQDQFPEFHEQIASQFGEWLSENSSRFGSDAGTGEGAGDSWSAERLFWDPDTQRIRLLECWYRRRLNVTVVRNQVTGDVSGDPDKVKALRARLKAMPHAAGDFQFFKRPVSMVRRAYVLNSLLLEDEPSPFDAPEFPIWPTVGYYFWRNPFGVVHPMKDPQREKNRRRSTIVEIVQKMPLGGFFNKRADGAKSEDIRKFGAGEVAEIPYENTPPQRIPPPELPQTLVWLEQQADRDVEDVSQIHRELLGNTTQKTVSGKAIEARQRGGMTTQEPLLESFLTDKEPAIKFMVRAIQQYMPVAKALRILGTLAAREQQAAAAAPPPVAGQPAQPGTVGPILQDPGADVVRLLQDAMLAEYDVAVDASKPWETTVQMAMWDSVREIMREFPGYIPPEVAVDKARDAGIIGEDDAMKILAYAQQKLAAEQGAAPPPRPAPRVR